MILRSSDLQSDSDLDSIRNSCDVSPVPQWLQTYDLSFIFSVQWSRNWSVRYPPILLHHLFFKIFSCKYFFWTTSCMSGSCSTLFSSPFRVTFTFSIFTSSYPRSLSICLNFVNDGSKDWWWWLKQRAAVQDQTDIWKHNDKNEWWTVLLQ